MSLRIRELQRRSDRSAVEAIDTSFETDVIFDVVARARGHRARGARLAAADHQASVDLLYYGSYMPGESALYLAKSVGYSADDPERHGDESGKRERRV